MGVSDRATEATRGFFTVMKDQPVTLALCVVIFALIGFVYLQSVQFSTAREANVKLFVQVQSEVQKLLAQCVIPPRQ